MNVGQYTLAQIHTHPHKRVTSRPRGVEVNPGQTGSGKEPGKALKRASQTDQYNQLSSAAESYNNDGIIT